MSIRRVDRDCCHCCQTVARLSLRDRGFPVVTITALSRFSEMKIGSLIERLAALDDSVDSDWNIAVDRCLSPEVRRIAHRELLPLEKIALEKDN